MNVQAGYAHGAYQTLLSSNALIGVVDDRIDDLLSLGDIICKYDLEQVVGVTLAHRHHELVQSERIVWRLEGESWLAKPEALDDAVLSPKTWIVHASSGAHVLRPTEFFPSEDTYSKEMAAAEIVLADQHFLQEFTEAVASMGADLVFGLGILHQREEFKQPGTTVFETSNLEKRITQAVVIPEDGLDSGLGGVTLWHFTKTSGVHGRHRCAHGNSGHCCGN